MRKFLLVAMMVMSLPMFAQHYTMRLANIYDAEGFETWDYVYSDTKGTDLVCINEIDLLFNMECRDSVYTDERGNITKLETWQKIGDEYFLVCYLDYEYDEKGLKISRKNYNWDKVTGLYNLGGTYRYYYDEEGRMTSWALEFAGVEEYQKSTIEYNEKGQAVTEILQQYNFGTYYLENFALIENEYDDRGNMIRSTENYWEEGTWAPQIVKINEFDEYDNCILAEQRTMSGTVQDRKIYAYDTSISASEVYYYANPEKDFPTLPVFKKLLKSFEWWAQNDNYELVNVANYNLNYEVIGNVAVEEVAFNSSVYPNPAQDFVMVESSEAEYVELVDIYGRVLFATEMSESVKVDMSELASGIYFVKLQANGATSVQKIMKK